MHHVRCREDYSAWTQPLKFSVVVEFDRPLAHQHKLRVPVLMGRMRHVTWEEGSLMQLDSLTCWKHAMHDGPGLAVGGVRNGQALKRISLGH